MVHYIEGIKNKSLVEVADIMLQELGGTTEYWQSAILDYAEQVVYTPDLTLWHVKKPFENNLYIDPENLSNYRMLCKLTKTYLASLTTIVKYISKFDSKKDTISRIDDLFRKVKSSEERYMAYCEQSSWLEGSSTLDEVSNNISRKSKQNAFNDLFHFKVPSKNENPEVGKVNTLLNYNFKM